MRKNRRVAIHSEFPQTYLNHCSQKQRPGGNWQKMSGGNVGFADFPGKIAQKCLSFFFATTTFVSEFSFFKKNMALRERRVIYWGPSKTWSWHYLCRQATHPLAANGKILSPRVRQNAYRALNWSTQSFHYLLYQGSSWHYFTLANRFGCVCVCKCRTYRWTWTKNGWAGQNGIHCWQGWGTLAELIHAQLLKAGALLKERILWIWASSYHYITHQMCTLNVSSHPSKVMQLWDAYFRQTSIWHVACTWAWDLKRHATFLFIGLDMC